MENDMTAGKILPMLLKFTWPLFIGNVFQQLYNMADTIIVGRYVSADALAAVGSTGTIMFLVLGFSQGLTSGFSVLTSQSYGAKDKKRARHSVSNGIILAAIVSLAVTFISVFLMPSILTLMNTPDNIYDDAYTYIVIICWGTAASVYYNLFSSFLRAVGNSVIPLLTLIFSAALNVGLDLLFIIQGHMGVAGAAIATVISQALSALICLIYIYKKLDTLRPEKNDWHLTKADTMHQMSVGLPMALQFGITAAGTMVMQAAINLFGSVAIQAYTSANKLHNILSQGMLSLGQTDAAFVAQNYGKGDIERIKKGVRISSGVAIVYSLAAMVAALTLVAPSLHIFFTGDVDMAELLPYALTYTRLSAAFYIPLSFIFVYRNSLQACGRALIPTLGGVVELIARLIMAGISMSIMSYPAACFCDSFAWLLTGIFDFVGYLFIIKKIEARFRQRSDS